MSGLRELDLDGVRDAVNVLREEGFRVREVTSLTQADHGVEFDLTLYADTRSKPLNPAVESFLQGIADTYREAFSALFASESGASVVVTLYEGEDPDEWAELAARDSSVKRVEVVETDADDEEDGQDPDDDEPEETPEEDAEDSLLDGGERVGTKRTDRGRDDGGDNE